MNIFVCVKQVPIEQCEIHLDEKNLKVEQEDFVWHLNSEDECAVELGLQLAEQTNDSLVTVIRVGEVVEDEALIQALAMGAQDAVLVETCSDLDPHATARALQGAIEYTGRPADLILCGTTSYDQDNYQVPQLLAVMQDMPAICGAISCVMDDGELIVGRQVGAGSTEVFRTQGPVLIACSYRITRPRYAPLPLLKRAHSKPLTRLSLADVGVSEEDQRIRYTNYRLPPQRLEGKVFDASEDEHLVEAVIKAIQCAQDEVHSL